MALADHFIQGLVNATQTVSVVVRPDPDDADKVLLSPHKDLGEKVSVPIDHIQGAVKQGSLVGLGPEYCSADVTFKKSFIETHEVSTALTWTNLNPSSKSNQVDCYDEQGNWFPCP